MMENKLLALLEKKPFDALNREEKALVLSHLSEKEYTDRHEALSYSKHILLQEASRLKANESIRTNALNALRDKKKKKHTPLIFLNHRIPTWSAVAALLLLYFLVEFLNQETVQPKAIIQTAKNDTVYIERIIRDTITKQIVNESSSDTNHSYSNNKQPEKEVIIEVDHPRVQWGNVRPSFDTNKHTYSKSLSEDALAQKMLTVEL